MVTAVVDPFTSLGWVAALIPFGSYYRTFWLGLGTIAAELMVAVLLTSLLRGLIDLALHLARNLLPLLRRHPFGLRIFLASQVFRGLLLLI